MKSREIAKPMDKEHFEQNVHERITLQWIVKGQEGREWTWERNK
jgi:hypothetical protein